MSIEPDRLVPWVDRSGSEVVLTAPSIQTIVGPELTIALPSWCTCSISVVPAISS